MQQNYRNIIKFGELQIKTCKKGGTLLRKKKYIFEDEKWVALCVHDKKVPLLEWYLSKDEVFNHEPSQVQDLLDCMFVNAVFGDDKRFIISFCDEKREPLEFCTLTSTQCVDWVKTISSVLKELNCLGESENLYLEFLPNSLSNCEEKQINCTLSSPISTSSSLGLKNTNNLLINEIPIKGTTNDLENVPSTSNAKSLILNNEVENLTNFGKKTDKPIIFPMVAKSYEENYSVKKFIPCSSPLSQKYTEFSKKDLQNLLEDQNIKSFESEKLLPPLPPRKLQHKHSKTQISCLENQSLNALITFHKNSTASDSQYDFPTALNANNFSSSVKKINDQNHIYNQIFTNNKDILHSTNCNSSLELEAVNCKTRLSLMSLEESQTSSSSDSRGSSINFVKNLLQFNQPVSQYDFASSPSLVINNLSAFNNTFREALNKPKTISLLLTICVEHIAFVEVGNKIWIAGWNPEKNNYLKNLIHFGDEVLQVGEEILKNINQIPSIFFTQSIPGTPIELKIRSIPFGLIYALTKPIHVKQSLGIVLHKKKNTIASIEEKSLAWMAKIPNQVSPYIYGSVEVASVITEIEGIPLNPFAKNDQFFLRIKKLAEGSSFNIIIHPLDLVKLIKTKLKQLDNYKKFLHNF